ncbi:DeoR/GlpR family DNA-binding transcription regulator [Enterococcus sp. UD-01]|jgi:DeoR family transcriptional regulator of aga operon|uniref:DeoR/GlpR family DNA-binding transcription regulator n=1 Tax=Enterococcus sp. UD-01 TaxID=3373911 RepID=UPI0038329330
MKVSQGDVFRRREQLIEKLKEQERLSVNELAAYFKVSAVTIRRDLLFLEKKKMIERYYGGVRLLSPQKRATYRQVEIATFPIKALVEKLAPLLHSGKQLFVGAGHFSAELLYALLPYDICILTNDARAFSLTRPNQKAIISICGGELEKDTQALVGDFAIHSFNKVTADYCIIEAEGFNTHEVSTKTLNESLVYRTMRQHTDGLKFVYTPACNLETVSDFMIDRTFLFDRLYTDEAIPDSVLALYQANKITVERLIDYN